MQLKSSTADSFNKRNSDKFWSNQDLYFDYKYKNGK